MQPEFENNQKCSDASAVRYGRLSAANGRKGRQRIAVLKAMACQIRTQDVAPVDEQNVCEVQRDADRLEDIGDGGVVGQFDQRLAVAAARWQEFLQGGEEPEPDFHGRPLPSFSTL